MDLKIRVYLVLLVLGIALHYVQAAGRCDWPRGTCTYIYDPCPPNWERCPRYDVDCPLATNHCCCRKRKPSIPPPFTPRPAKNVCDWPRGTCTYIYDPCPPNWERCPKYDRGCTVPTNHCCCRKNPPVPDEPKKSAPVSPRKCDWPRGTCTYIYDPCPPDWELCPQYNDCPLATNHCCCRKRKPSINPPLSPRPAKNVCDWPRGTCTYIYDPCPPNWKRCPQYDYGCTVSTNHCCCRKNPPGADEPKKPAPVYQDVAAPCDWPHGTCTYTGDPCPPNWKRCPDRDSGCSLPTNHCCCRTTPPPPAGKCDWPRGTCTYYKDPCPPNWERCSDYDIDCKLKTNHCCCRKKTPVRDAAQSCDWPVGTCTHKGEPCPPGWNRCKGNDSGCTNPENHCCCRP